MQGGLGSIGEAKRAGDDGGGMQERRKARRSHYVGVPKPLNHNRAPFTRPGRKRVTSRSRNPRPSGRASLGRGVAHHGSSSLCSFACRLAQRHTAQRVATRESETWASHNQSKANTSTCMYAVRELTALTCVFARSAQSPNSFPCYLVARKTRIY